MRALQRPVPPWKWRWSLRRKSKPEEKDEHLVAYVDGAQRGGLDEDVSGKRKKDGIPDGDASAGDLSLFANPREMSRRL